MHLTENKTAQQEIEKINNNLEKQWKLQNCYAYWVDNMEVTYKKLNEEDKEETKIVKQILNIWIFFIWDTDHQPTQLIDTYHDDEFVSQEITEEAVIDAFEQEKTKANERIWENVL